MKHIYSKIRNILLCFLAVAVGFLSSCSEDTLSSISGTEDSNVILVGADAEGLVATSYVSTRATGDGTTKDAETVDWLVQPLKNGFDITYGKVGDESTERVAILKLKDDNPASGKTYNVSAYGYAEYSFNYRGEHGEETINPAVWYDNGYHYFEGVHVPNRLRYNGDTNNIDQDNRSIQGATGLAAVTNLTTNQSNDISTGTDNELGNYTLLEHYLGMPANTQIAATVARIKLPFRHRLAHVLAYILIDPSLMNGEVATVIKGYKNTQAEKDNGKDDPNTTSIRFCNVDVLEGVHDKYNEDSKTHTLTPKWTKVRKAVPHFEKELATFKTYQSEEKTYYQGTTGFPESCPTGFKEVVYSKVPVYDLIVRPTYTSENNVMYDEDLTGTTKAAIAAKTNQIDFTITLDNGLTYEKNFVFDLDANYETIVYLKITREGVDYNESGSEKWVETENRDDWYGVDNVNGHNLAKAGSSWQRAYYNTDLGDTDKVTDGGFYDEDTSGEDGTKGQYVLEDTWIKYFSQAYEGGEHHGDYFVLANDITIDARSLPDDFVFTGHLDGFNTHGSRGYHTITLTNINADKWYEYVETTDYSITPLYDTKPEEEFPSAVTTQFSLPTLYYKTPDNYTPEECDVYNEQLPGAWNYETVKTPAKDAVYYTEEEINAYNTANAEGIANGTITKLELGAIKEPASDEEHYTVEEIRVHNESLEGAIKPTDIKVTYYELPTAPSLQDVANIEKEYYYEVSKDSYERYTLPVLYNVVERTPGSTLFAGLDGIYTTKQENDANPYSVTWEANVHKEGNYWLPYKDPATKTGWRAEVLNVTVIGCNMFKVGAVITGNVQNCYEQPDASDETTKQRVTDNIPAYPKYK